jgi:hypothetical protein
MDDAVIDLVSPLALPAPTSIAETGLSADQLGQLLVKTLYGGEASGTRLAERLCLPYSVLESVLEHGRVEKLLEVRGASGTGTAGYRYALTDLGRDRAKQYIEVSQYVGPAPVPLRQYVAHMKRLAAERGHIHRDRVAAGFSHLVINPVVLDQLGPAINSGKSIFLYGPPGNGKTVMAEGVGRTLGGDMHVPHAIDVDGQIVTVYDPVNHRPIEGPAGTGSLLASTSSDRRWQRIRRPVVTVGGELTLEMLDLSFNHISKFYEGPLQLKANGGVLIVDDFGRQRIPPRDLLNRWIVPLESRLDFLTLHTGRKFEIPFDVLIIFATNLDPLQLADEAFLRRIPYKIYAHNPTLEEFARIFELNCRHYGLKFDPVIVEYLQRSCYRARGLEMRACHPRDLVAQIVDVCRYQDREPVITRERLDAACKSYFLEEGETERSPAPSASRQP